MVSYQYLDSLAEPGTPTTITSPVVSYQYYDWPGDENLAFTNSPHVSYYFSGGVSATLSGTLHNTAGAPVAGAAVVLMRYGTVFWQGTTNASGAFTAANIPATNYTVKVTKAGYRTLMDNIAAYAGGTGTLSLVIANLPVTLAATDVNRMPPLSALGTTSTGSVLKAYVGGSFVTNTTLFPDRMTIVLCHGWTGNPADWALDMAQRITARLAPAQPPNIVVWDWHEAAAGSLLSIVGKIDVAATEGRSLGEALQQALGASYGGHVHFIGHSLGTIVNRYACDYVHAGFPPADRSSMNSPTPWLATQTTTHVTLLDEAEFASVVGSQMITSTFVASILAGPLAGVETAAKNWKSPLPKDASWVDNYISAVGFQHDAAVNVCLVKSAETTLNGATAHGYAHVWYRQSANPSSGFPSPPLGFDRSFEKALTFPPTGSGMQPGSLWIENTATADPLDMTLDTNPDFGEATRRIAAAFAVQIGKKVKEGTGVVAGQVVQAGAAGAIALANTTNDYVIKPTDAVGQAVMSSYMTGITVAGEIGGTGIYKTGLVITETKEKVGNMIDATQDFVANTTASLDPDSLQLGPVTIPFMRLRFFTQPAQLAGKGGALAAGQPAYAWMTVHVPADAGFLAFDFTVTGQPVEDRIVCAINDANVFNLPAKFAPDGVPSSTDLIDVSALAGQDIELLFGLTGGTSTNCEVAIDGVRFITVPQPKIGIVDAAPNLLLKWPAAATGWILEATDSLAPANWQAVPMDAGVAVDSGVVTFQQPKIGPRKFYRLKRTP